MSEENVDGGQVSRIAKEYLVCEERRKELFDLRKYLIFVQILAKLANFGVFIFSILHLTFNPVDHISVIFHLKLSIKFELFNVENMLI